MFWLNWEKISVLYFFLPTLLKIKFLQIYFILNFRCFNQVLSLRSRNAHWAKNKLMFRYSVTWFIFYRTGGIFSFYTGHIYCSQRRKNWDLGTKTSLKMDFLHEKSFQCSYFDTYWWIHLIFLRTLASLTQQESWWHVISNSFTQWLDKIRRIGLGKG
jgi:hypothetical protein